MDGGRWATSRSPDATKHRRVARPRPGGAGRGLLGVGVPTVTVALGTPWDLASYPRAPVHLATYSILPESLAALAGVLSGRLRPVGRLPVALARDATTGLVGAR
ncbi:MAG: hypothetical protein ABI628_12520 [Chloroflexota bacterium]